MSQGVRPNTSVSSFEELEFKEPTPSIAPSLYESAQYSKKWRVAIAVLVGGILIALCLLGFYLNAESRKAEYLAAEEQKKIKVAEMISHWRKGSDSCLEISPNNCSGRSKTVLLVAIGGLRKDMISSRWTPALYHLTKCGVSAHHLTPVYPASSQPNLYTIVTGLYPESHGIVGPVFYDTVLNRTFRAHKLGHKEAQWWGGEPIWTTIKKEAKYHSAMHFWPGINVLIEGNKALLQTRVNKVEEWLLEDEQSERPRLVGIYFGYHATVAEKYGIFSAEANSSLLEVDQQLDRLMTSVYDAERLSCIDLVVVSDHGLAPATCGASGSFYLETFMPDIQKRARVISGEAAGAVGRLEAIGTDTNEQILEQLQCKNRRLRALSKDLLPNRYHYVNRNRIENVTLDTLPGSRIVTNDTNYCRLADYGFNNIEQTMQGVFLARGPSFRAGYSTKGFRNVELYNLLATIIGVKPAPNNGTEGSLYHILSCPPVQPIVNTSDTWVENLQPFLHDRARDPSFMDEIQKSREATTTTSTTTTHATTTAAQPATTAVPATPTSTVTVAVESSAAVPAATSTPTAESSETLAATAAAALVPTAATEGASTEPTAAVSEPALTASAATETAAANAPAMTPVPISTVPTPTLAADIGTDDASPAVAPAVPDAAAATSTAAPATSAPKTTTPATEAPITAAPATAAPVTAAPATVAPATAASPTSAPTTAARATAASITAAPAAAAPATTAQATASTTAAPAAPVTEPTMAVSVASTKAAPVASTQTTTTAASTASSSPERREERMLAHSEGESPSQPQQASSPQPVMEGKDGTISFGTASDAPAKQAQLQEEPNVVVPMESEDDDSVTVDGSAVGIKNATPVTAEVIEMATTGPIAVSIEVSKDEIPSPDKSLPSADASTPQLSVAEEISSTLATETTSTEALPSTTSATQLAAEQTEASVPSPSPGTSSSSRRRRQAEEGCNCNTTGILHPEASGWDRATKDYIDFHIPFGYPLYSADDAPKGTHYILPHHSHFTGYIGELGTALWSSFTLTSQALAEVLATRPQLPEGLDEQQEQEYEDELLADAPTPLCWLADPRLPRKADQQCKEYLDQDRYNTDRVTMRQLFPDEFESTDRRGQEGYFLTNAIALRPGYVKGGRRNALTVIEQLVQQRGVVNVITGPVWDRDFNGKADTIVQIRAIGEYLTPSHVFYLLTSCNPDSDFEGENLGECPMKDLDTLAFVLPNTVHEDNCHMSYRDYVSYHLTSIVDVQRLTGLRFFKKYIRKTPRPKPACPASHKDPALSALLAYQPLQLW